MRLKIVRIFHSSADLEEDQVKSCMPLNSVAQNDSRPKERLFQESSFSSSNQDPFADSPPPGGRHGKLLEHYGCPIDN